MNWLLWKYRPVNIIFYTFFMINYCDRTFLSQNLKPSLNLLRLLRSRVGPNRFLLIRAFWLKNFFDSQGLFWFVIHLDESFYDNNLILIHFDSLSKRKNRLDLFWFTSIHNSFGFLFILIRDSIWFYSFWFGLILIRRESRFTRESWFTCKSKSNRIKNKI